MCHLNTIQKKQQKIHFNSKSDPKSIHVGDVIILTVGLWPKQRCPSTANIKYPYLFTTYTLELYNHHGISHVHMEILFIYFYFYFFCCFVLLSFLPENEMMVKGAIFLHTSLFQAGGAGTLADETPVGCFPPDYAVYDITYLQP